jgi:hypothetical protein
MIGIANELEALGTEKHIVRIDMSAPVFPFELFMRNSSGKFFYAGCFRTAQDVKDFIKASK